MIKSGLSRSSDPTSEQSQVKVKGSDFLSKLSQQFSEAKPKGQDGAMQPYNILPIYKQENDEAPDSGNPIAAVTSTDNSRTITQSPSKTKLLPAPKVGIDSSQKKKKKKKPRLLINTFNTQYDVIMKAAAELGFAEKKLEPQFYGNNNKNNNDSAPITVMKSNDFTNAN